MNYYEQIANQADCVCRPWPLFPAADADNEIARLRAHVSQLREDNKALRSSIRSLILANAELQELIRLAVKK